VLRLLHLSDVHFGVNGGRSVHRWTRDNKPDPTHLAEVLVQDAEQHPDAVVISGDTGWSGVSDDYSFAAEFLGVLRRGWPDAKIVVCAGNHDVDLGVAPDSAQEAFAKFVTSSCAEPFASVDAPRLVARERLLSQCRLSVGTDEAAIFAVNSAAYSGKGGTPAAVGPEVLRAVESLVATVPDHALRVFVLHHHLLPFAVPDWEATIDSHAWPDKADPSTVLNSARLQGWLAENQFHLVLHGHKHVTHGRRDTLWRKDDPPEGREMLIVGAGSAGVEEQQRRGEPLSYNVILAHHDSRRRWRIDVEVRRIADAIGRDKSTPHFSFGAEVGPNCSGGPTIFESDRMDTCHASIRRRIPDDTKVFTFISIVHAAVYAHPETTRKAANHAAEDVVRRSFSALHPEFRPSKKWQDPTSLDDDLRRASRRYQFQHGHRLFGAIERFGTTEPTRPIIEALKRLKNNNESNAYVSLYRAENDAFAEPHEPLPALMGVQFVRSERHRLDLIATFRKIELSFWWVVNMLEAIELLQWAARQDEAREAGKVIFFAPIAEWKTREPEPVIVAMLDEEPLSNLVALLHGVSNDDEASAAQFASLLRDKRENTNAKNIDVSGLGAISAILQGLVEGANARKAKALKTIHEQIVLAESKLRAAMTPRQPNQTLLPGALAALEEAERLVTGK
jgi:3',5'-cyclic AMP phosphodiesterase CpdA